MKKLKLFLMAMTMIALPANVMADNDVDAITQATVQENRPTHKQQAKAQADRIAHDLALDKEKTAKFKSTYAQYRKEIRAIRANKADKNEQTLSIRKKYNKVFATFLTQKQIERVYELETK